MKMMDSVPSRILVKFSRVNGRYQSQQTRAQFQKVLLVLSASGALNRNVGVGWW